MPVSLCALFVASAAWAAPEFKSGQEKSSYAIGVNVAKKLKQQGVSFDAAQLSQGVSDELSGKAQLADAEIETILKKLQSDVRERKAAELKKLAAINMKRGTEYQAEYAKREGVKTLEGMQCRILQEGKGAKPVDDDSVLCNYRGMLVDGTVFDASPPGQPAAFRLNKLIPGWREALKEMKVGSKWELVVPAVMAYGESGSAPAIGPNETLIFELELVGID